MVRLVRGGEGHDSGELYQNLLGCREIYSGNILNTRTQSLIRRQSRLSN